MSEPIKTPHICPVCLEYDVYKELGFSYCKSCNHPLDENYLIAFNKGFNVGKEFGKSGRLLNNTTWGNDSY